MLKIVKNPVFTAPVKVTVPVEGGVRESTFTGRFRAVSVSEAESFNLMSSEGTSDYLRAILVGWDGIVDDDGQPISFSDETRNDLIDIPFIRTAILTTYNTAMLGAKRGN